MSLLIWARNNWLKRMNRHPSLLPAMWLNWSNCSLDSIYRPLVNIWNVSIRLHFILSALCWSSSQNYGNTKGQAFGLFVPNGCIWGPCGPACPLLLCNCVSAVWSDVTLRRHYPHHCASLPLCTGNQLWQPWPSNLIGPVTLWPAAIEMVLKLTTITCRPLDYCNNTPMWTQVFCFWPSACFCSLFPLPLWSQMDDLAHFFVAYFLCCIIFLRFKVWWYDFLRLFRLYWYLCPDQVHNSHNYSGIFSLHLLLIVQPLSPDFMWLFSVGRVTRVDPGSQ